MLPSTYNLVCTHSCLQQTITEPLSNLHQQDWLLPTSLSVYHKILQNPSQSSIRRTKNWSCPAFTPLSVCSIHIFVYMQYSHLCLHAVFTHLYAVFTPFPTCSIYTFLYAVPTPLSVCSTYNFVDIQYSHLYFNAVLTPLSVCTKLLM